MSAGLVPVSGVRFAHATKAPVLPPDTSSIKDKLEEKVSTCQAKFDEDFFDHTKSPYYSWFFSKGEAKFSDSISLNVKLVVTDLAKNLHYAGCHRQQLKDKSPLNNLVWGESMTSAVEEYNTDNPTQDIRLDDKKNLVWTSRPDVTDKKEQDEIKKKIEAVAKKINAEKLRMTNDWIEEHKYIDEAYKTWDKVKPAFKVEPAFTHEAGVPQRVVYVLVSTPEFTYAGDQPALAMMGYILPEYEIPIPAGDQFDPFHGWLMTGPEMEYKNKGWRTAWKGKVWATLETLGTVLPKSRVVLLAVEGGPETQWEKKWLLEKAMMARTGEKRLHTKIEGLIVFKHWQGLVLAVAHGKHLPEKGTKTANNGQPRNFGDELSFWTGQAWADEKSIAAAQYFYPDDTDTTTQGMKDIKLDFVVGEAK